jgi:DNA topoisomerase IA
MAADRTSPKLPFVRHLNSAPCILPLWPAFIPRPSSVPQADLKRSAKRSDWLLIATDNDREGENIGMEIVEVCKQGL